MADVIPFVRPPLVDKYRYLGGFSDLDWAWIEFERVREAIEDRKLEHAMNIAQRAINLLRPYVDGSKRDEDWQREIKAACDRRDRARRGAETRAKNRERQRAALAALGLRLTTDGVEGGAA
jgi:hypothetical protein